MLCAGKITILGLRQVEVYTPGSIVQSRVQRRFGVATVVSTLEDNLPCAWQARSRSTWLVSVEIYSEVVCGLGVDPFHLAFLGLVGSFQWVVAWFLVLSFTFCPFLSFACRRWAEFKE